jgi:hypothetical protein
VHNNLANVASRIAQDVYNKAAALYAKEYTKEKLKRGRVEKSHTMQDMVDSINLAQDQYLSRTNSRPRKWLARLSSRLMFYGKIMDMLAQHHPEYVSLGWGTLKFIFVVGCYRSKAYTGR